MTPLGLGNDGLGSLRWPAQCCGISVLKPTLGRIPAAATIEPMDAPIGAQLTAVEGPMARRVADLRAAFEVMAGPTWRDPWTVPAPLRGPEPARPIRVALVPDPAGQGTAHQVQDGVRKAAARWRRGLRRGGGGAAVDSRGGQDRLAMLNTAEFRALWRARRPCFRPTRSGSCRRSTRWPATRLGRAAVDWDGRCRRQGRPRIHGTRVRVARPRERSRVAAEPRAAAWRCLRCRRRCH